LRLTRDGSRVLVAEGVGRSTSQLTCFVTAGDTLIAAMTGPLQGAGVVRLPVACVAQSVDVAL
jgi:hypothetical protein